MATRDLTAGVLSAIVAGTVRPAIFYEGEFVDGDTGAQAFLRLWTGIGPLSWDGKTWLGGGKLLKLSPLEETREIKAVGFSVTISGIASADVQRALAGIRQNRPGRLWLALLDESSAVIPDPYQLQRGKLDTNILEDDGESATISVQYESRLVDLEKPRERYYTSEDQRLDHPEDDGFDQVPSLQDLELVWGV
jgi:hypothetical protein